MSRRFPPYPEKPHKSGRARITVNRRDHYLGVFGSPESWQEYQRLLAEWTLAEQQPKPKTPSLTVADIVQRFMDTARAERTNPDGSRPWTELVGYDHVSRPLLFLFGDTPAADFGPKSLKQLQTAMATGQWGDPSKRRKPKWCRRVVNRHTIRVQTMWRWAESEELVPPGSHAALSTVDGLRRYQHGVRETPPVPPAPQAHVDAALPHMNPVAADMVRLLLLTGARPGELCRWTAGDVIRGGQVEVSRGSYADLGQCWCVWLSRHKTEDTTGADRGPGRFVLLSPAAQAILKPYLDRPTDAPLFSPMDGRKQSLAARRERKGTKVQPYTPVQQPKKRVHGAYTPMSLGKAVTYACRKAGVPNWTPYQLRHSAVTNWGKHGDPEAARILAGHSDLGTTRIYLVDDLERAAKFLGQAS